jgi:hypothetical protein
MAALASVLAKLAPRVPSCTSWLCLELINHYQHSKNGKLIFEIAKEATTLLETGDFDSNSCRYSTPWATGTATDILQMFDGPVYMKQDNGAAHVAQTAGAGVRRYKHGE